MPSVDIPDRIHALRNVLGFLREQGGHEPGGFTTHLIEAFAHADAENFRRLAAGFPHYSRAWRLYKNEGPDALREEITRLEGML